ncbi:hypothetical protein [Desulfoluna sp.]|uniref:hypothetical protein n=1 Tax=Desulfoluna sp. TaxID=2045199 RepID=UPI002633B7C4|nr:hypothetical protein [Desulfoluna sp.]
MTDLRRTITILSFSLLFLLHAASVFCAPVGNIGDPALWKDGLFTDAGSFSIFISAEYDSQDNTLDPQQRRIRWDDPRTQLDEERHYEQIRSSKSTMACTGGRLGVMLSDSWTLYALSGVCDTELTFYHTDTTINFGFELENDFESKSDFYYGVGTTVLLHQGTFSNIPLKLGMDLKYRRFDFEDDRLEADGLFYSATLDEFQLAVMLSAETGRIHPYAGARLSSITGKEHYINSTGKSYYYPAEHIDYRDDITWSKNIGFVAGASLHLLKSFSLNVESRFGDEEGYGVSATVKF